MVAPAIPSLSSSASSGVQSAFKKVSNSVTFAPVSFGSPKLLDSFAGDTSTSNGLKIAAAVAAVAVLGLVIYNGKK